MRNTYDDSGWPIVHVTMAPGNRGVDDIEHHLAQLATFVEHGPCAFVLNLTQAEPLNPTERKRTADAMQQREALFPGNTLAIATVTSTAMQAGVTTALVWMMRLPFPARAHTSMAAALKWLEPYLPGIKEQPPATRAAGHAAGPASPLRPRDVRGGRTP